jgi:hypothetical protein
LYWVWVFSVYTVNIYSHSIQALLSLGLGGAL